MTVWFGVALMVFAFAPLGVDAVQRLHRTGPAARRAGPLVWASIWIFLAGYGLVASAGLVDDLAQMLR